MSHIFTQKQLERDNHRLALAFLMQVMLLGACWVYWLKQGRIKVYEVSTSANVVGDMLIRAEFPLSAATLISPGQSVRIEFDNQPWPAFDILTGHVRHLRSNPESRILVVFVDLESHQSNRNQKALVNKMSGKVLIEVGNKTPLAIMMNNFARTFRKSES